MARIEKTVFISYRRTDVYTALAVYENLKNQDYDVFFDYRSISSGDFEQIITSNIRARAHFLLILTPTALDRCNEPGDWLRREIEIAIDEKRNIVPLFFKGFRFGDPSVTEKLTGKLKNLSRYNGMNVHEDFFDEAMHRLRTQYLSIPLNTVLHPVSTEVQQIVIEQQLAADKALEQVENVKELAKQVEKKPSQGPTVDIPVRREITANLSSSFNFRLVGMIAGGVLVVALLILGAVKLFQNQSAVNPNPTSTFQVVTTQTSQALATDTPSITETIVPPTPTLKALGTPLPTSSLSIGSMMTGKDGMTLLYVPAGEFTMGSNDGSDDEKPNHAVYLDSFWIDETEVTNSMFTNFIGETGYTTEAEKAGKSYLSKDGSWQGVVGAYWSHPSGPSSGISDIMNHPVVHISWNDARAYCAWTGRRLPTEAEWEKAASWDEENQQKYVYPWGNEFACTNGNFDDETQIDSSVVPGGENCDGFPRTSPVGSFPSGASPYGALDMAGNVWEWVADWYGANYYSTLGENAHNPQGPTSGQYRVLRGGSWYNDDYHGVRSAHRLRANPSESSFDVGFRCAMSVTP